VWPKSDLDVSDDVAVISLVSLKILPMLLAHPSQMLVLLEQVSLVSVLGAAQLFFCKNFQASSSGWKSQSFRLR